MHLLACRPHKDPSVTAAPPPSPTPTPPSGPPTIPNFLASQELCCLFWSSLLCVIITLFRCSLDVYVVIPFTILTAEISVEVSFGCCCHATVPFWKYRPLTSGVKYPQHSWHLGRKWQSAATANKIRVDKERRYAWHRLQFRLGSLKKVQSYTCFHLRHSVWHAKLFEDEVKKIRKPPLIDASVIS